MFGAAGRGGLSGVAGGWGGREEWAGMIPQPLPGTDLVVSPQIFGCMRLGGGWSGGPLTSEEEARAFAALDAAVEAGFTFFDHADIYCRGKSEEAFAAWVAARRADRGRFVLQSKCGIRFQGDPEPGDPGRYDFSREHILRSVDGILKRLRIERLDILLLHRPDALCEPEEVAAAFDAVHVAGKVAHFGVSNHNAWQVELLTRHLRRPLVANQLQFSLLHTGLVDAGTAVNQVRPQFHTPGDGTLDACRLHGLQVQAWSPMAGGALGRPAGADAEPRLAATVKLLAEVASRHGVAPETIALAWILRHPARIAPVTGTLNPERIRAQAAATRVTLSREEWYSLYTAARGERMA